MHDRWSPRKQDWSFTIKNKPTMKNLDKLDQDGIANLDKISTQLVKNILGVLTVMDCKDNPRLSRKIVNQNLSSYARKYKITGWKDRAYFYLHVQLQAKRMKAELPS